jgi:hypothetical protein
MHSHSHLSLACLFRSHCAAASTQKDGQPMSIRIRSNSPQTGSDHDGAGGMDWLKLRVIITEGWLRVSDLDPSLGELTCEG